MGGGSAARRRGGGTCESPHFNCVERRRAAAGASRRVGSCAVDASAARLGYLRLDRLRDGGQLRRRHSEAASAIAAAGTTYWGPLGSSGLVRSTVPTQGIGRVALAAPIRKQRRGRRHFGSARRAAAIAPATMPAAPRQHGNWQPQDRSSRRASKAAQSTGARHWSRKQRRLIGFARRASQIICRCRRATAAVGASTGAPCYGDSMVFGWMKGRRRRRLLAAPFPADWRETLRPPRSAISLSRRGAAGSRAHDRPGDARRKGVGRRRRLHGHRRNARDDRRVRGADGERARRAVFLRPPRDGRDPPGHDAVLAQPVDRQPASAGADGARRRRLAARTRC